jgi:hypothetical protein
MNICDASFALHFLDSRAFLADDDPHEITGDCNLNAKPRGHSALNFKEIFLHLEEALSEGGGASGSHEHYHMKALHLFLIFYLFFEVDLDQHASHLCGGLCRRMDHNARTIRINC